MESFSVIAAQNNELIMSMMDLPEKMREEMAVKSAAIQSDVTTSIVATTKQFNETLDETKRELKDKVDSCTRGVRSAERKANTVDANVKELDKKLDKKTDDIEASVKELDKKVDKKIKAAQSEVSKVRSVNVKAEVKNEVHECLRGFGAYLSNYFGAADGPGAAAANALAAAPAAADGFAGPLPAADAAERSFLNAARNAVSNAARNAVSDAARNAVSNVPEHAFSNAPGHTFSDTPGHAISNAAGYAFSNAAERATSDAGGHATSNAAGHAFSNATERVTTNAAERANLNVAERANSNASEHASPLPVLSTSVASAAPLFRSDAVSEPVPIVPLDKFMKYQVLKNEGYKFLMRKIKFTDVNHLAQLVKVDNSEIMRRCIIFTDRKFNNYDIDYVLQSGFAVRQLGSGSHPALPGGREQADLLAVHHTDLSQLRVVQMKINPNVMLEADRVKYVEWERRWKPPTYLYDLGELVLRKKIVRQPQPLVTISTPYNLLLEVSRTKRRVWIVMAPENEISKKAPGSVKDSNLAFNGLEYHRMALVAQHISEIEFDRAEFDPSAASFESAHRLILESLCPGFPLVDFSKTISIKQMCNDLAK
ncbi:hypothetical protein PG996_011357 [Apiospora saccharicola]|uniref:Uncharacterized protein n=1 Tax=Apiospora saccharicola TaxID=335842 RepID=A0ABR1UEV9_9PEZI